MGSSMENPQNNKNRTIIQSGKLASGYTGLEEISTHPWSLQPISQQSRDGNNKCSLTNAWIKKNVLYTQRNISHKKMKNPTICNNMDE